MELDIQKRAALVGIYDSAGLQAVLDVLENIVTESENKLIGEIPANKDLVTALHAIAYAQRAMFQTAAGTIDYIVAEQRGVDRKNLLDARK